MPGQSKKSLNQVIAGCYIFPAVTVLTVGHLTPLQLPATSDALSVFFVVAALFAIARHFMAWCIHTGCTAYQIVVHSRMHHVTMSMVALAGPTSVGPVSGNAGSEIPVRAIASEYLTSCDSMIQCYQRLPQWLLPQPQNTQNSRFPNSAMTAVVKSVVRMVWRVSFMLMLSLKTIRQPPVFFMHFLISKVIFGPSVRN
ncbi:ash family protein [Salmonella enterica]|nr:ash family protein [Salmonella enterica]